MLKIINGYKFYGKRVVLQDINLTFEDGKMYGIVGVNGSGKTLIAKALTGYIKLTKGSVFQDDFEIRKKIIILLMQELLLKIHNSLMIILLKKI